MGQGEGGRQIHANEDPAQLILYRGLVETEFEAPKYLVRDAPYACARFIFSSRRGHTRCLSDWSSDVCSSDLEKATGDRNGDKVISRRPDQVLNHFSIDRKSVAPGQGGDPQAPPTITTPHF